MTSFKNQRQLKIDTSKIYIYCKIKVPEYVFSKKMIRDKGIFIVKEKTFYSIKRPIFIVYTRISDFEENLTKIINL